jgi:hypothetical protein
VIYDALLSLDLPTELGPPLPTGAITGLENLLFTGRWASRRSTCPLSAAVVLARGCRVLGALGCAGLEVLDDAGCVLDQAVPAVLGDASEPRWPETLPPGWLEQPCELTLRGGLRERGVVAAVTLRYCPRHDPEHGALTGSLRALWDAGPAEGEEDGFRRSVEAALRDEHSLCELHRRLRDRGAQLTDTLIRGLEQAFDTALGHSHGRVLVLHGYRAQPERFADLLAGLPAPQRATIGLLEARVGRSPTRWPALDPTGVHGQLHRGRFVPSEEVADVA